MLKSEIKSTTPSISELKEQLKELTYTNLFFSHTYLHKSQIYSSESEFIQNGCLTHVELEGPIHFSQSVRPNGFICYNALKIRFNLMKRVSKMASSPVVLKGLIHTRQLVHSE